MDLASHLKGSDIHYYTLDNADGLAEGCYYGVYHEKATYPMMVRESGYDENVGDYEVFEGECVPTILKAMIEMQDRSHVPV